MDRSTWLDLRCCGFKRQEPDDWHRRLGLDSLSARVGVELAVDDVVGLNVGDGVLWG